MTTTNTAHGFAALKPGQALEPWQYELPTLADHEIRIAITHCGVCHSDLDIINDTWADAHYPMIPGHEIIGTVIKKGNKVTTFTLGQRVGVCWQQSNCGHCHYCEHRQTHYCHELNAIGMRHQGGFADSIQVHENYACQIPDELESSTAAPLLCAGATVFHALTKHQIKAGMRVGIIGIGGLGHLALQFAHKLGAEVTAFDLSEDKKEDCLSLGAQTFVNCSQASKLKQYNDTFDFLLATADTAINLKAFAPLLRAEGTLCFAGMPKTAMALPLFEMIIGSKSISAVNIGDTDNVVKTLAFAGRHGIAARVESLAIDNVNQAIERLKKHQPRYRVVLTM